MAKHDKRDLGRRAPGFLRRVYEKESELLRSKLELTDSITHDGTKGQIGEEHWITLLQNYLPSRFRVRSGVVIDSRGRTSHQIDVVIHDVHFTPNLLVQGSHGYILAEAVYAVFEVKPTLNSETLAYAADKAASVRALHRTSAPTIASGRRQAPRALFPIVGGILTREVAWGDGLGAKFEKQLAKQRDACRIDCGCVLGAGCFDGFDRLPHDVKEAIGTGELARAAKDVGLIYFLFRLLGWLNGVGTVPAVDWNAYANVLRGRASGSK